MDVPDFGTVKDGSGTMNIQRRRTRARVIKGDKRVRESLVECIDHPIVHDTAILEGSRERCQISTAKKSLPQLLGQILNNL
jgi:hypothetical protein